MSKPEPSQQDIDAPPVYDEFDGSDFYMNEDSENDDYDEPYEITEQESNGDMRAITENIQQLFQYAVEGECEKLVDLLNVARLHPDAEDRVGHTPFLVAARHGQVQVLHSLLNEGCNAAHRTHNGNSAWMLASAAGELATLSFLMEEVGPRMYPRDFEAVLVNRNRDSVLMFASMAGRLEIVKYLLGLASAAGLISFNSPIHSTHGARMHPLSLLFTNIDGLNVVMCACESGNSDVVDLLLQAVQESFGELPVGQPGIPPATSVTDPTIKGMDGELTSPAASLSTLGVQTDGTSMRTPQTTSTGKKKSPQSQEHGKGLRTALYLNQRDLNGNTALHIACKFASNETIVLNLLRLGADPSIRNDIGQSAIDLWSSKGARALRLMLEVETRLRKQADAVFSALLEDLENDSTQKKKKKTKAKKTKYVEQSSSSQEHEKDAECDNQASKENEDIEKDKSLEELPVAEVCDTNLGTSDPVIEAPEVVSSPPPTPSPVTPIVSVTEVQEKKAVVEAENDQDEWIEIKSKPAKTNEKPHVHTPLSSSSIKNSTSSASKSTTKEQKKKPTSSRDSAKHTSSASQQQSQQNTTKHVKATATASSAAEKPATTPMKVVWGNIVPATLSKASTQEKDTANKNVIVQLPVTSTKQEEVKAAPAETQTSDKPTGEVASPPSTSDAATTTQSPAINVTEPYRRPIIIPPNHASKFKEMMESSPPNSQNQFQFVSSLSSSIPPNYNPQLTSFGQQNMPMSYGNSGIYQSFQQYQYQPALDGVSSGTMFPNLHPNMSLMLQDNKNQFGVKSGSSVGPLSRQLHRLDPHAEILGVTPMHILGFNLNSLSSEQLDCCENVLTTLMTNIKTVKEKNAQTTISELSQQLADAQAIIQNLTLQVESLNNQSFTLSKE